MQKNKSINTLHVDIEGGFGGSARSLFEIVKLLKKASYNPYIIYAKAGPNKERYESINVEAELFPEFFTFVPRKIKSLKNFIFSLPKIKNSFTLAKKIEKEVNNREIDVIHLNYEGLFATCFWLRVLGVKTPVIMHSRAIMPMDNLFTRWIVRTISRNASFVFFISDNEKDVFKGINPKFENYEILFNISSAKTIEAPNWESNEVVYMGNLNYSKGADRLVDVANELKLLNSKLKIKVYGEDRQGKGFEGKIRSKIKELDISDYIELCGHTKVPYEIMGKSFATIRPSRENDPWGRDLIESTVIGIPVLATGSYGGVVEDSKTGYLFDSFDAKEMAEKLEGLKSNKEIYSTVYTNSVLRGKEKFSGVDQIEKIKNVIDNLLESQL